jgi:spermidine synthase
VARQRFAEIITGRGTTRRMTEPKIRLDERVTDQSGVYFDATRLIETVTSEFQTIEVFDTQDFGKLMRIDGCNMVSERDEFFYHENLIHPVASAHPNPQNVLIIGGGDGGAAEEMLKHPSVTKVTLCELDVKVVEVSKRHFATVHRGVFDDPRLSLMIGDGIKFIDETREQFDLITLDLTDPMGAAKALYSQAFFADCKAKLGIGGALTIHIGSPFAHLSRVRESMANLRATFRVVNCWFVHIPMYGATWGFACGSDALDIREISAVEINKRLTERRVNHRQFYNGAMHHAMLALPEYIRTLLR